MKTLILVTAALLGSFTLAQDCTELWQNDLATGVIGPKSFMGDTDAAYAEYEFHVNPSTVIRLHGSYPFARFLSVESYRTKKKRSFADLHDSQIVPDAGSSNPFVDAVAANAVGREYTIDFVPEGTKWTGAANVLKVTSQDDVASIWVRYYAPNPGVTVTFKDLPTLEALDATTGNPVACPEAIPMRFYTRYPELLTYIVPHKTVLDFKPYSVHRAGNSAIPSYPEAHSKMRPREVAVVRFKAPLFAQISGGMLKAGEVRYWSFCSLNVVKNMTLACLPDYLAHVDKNGFVNVVFGSQDSVKTETIRRGYDFLPDNRDNRQKIITLVYRNILPSAAFTQTSLFKGDYNPAGRICSAEEYLSQDPACDPGT